MINIERKHKAEVQLANKKGEFFKLYSEYVLLKYNVDLKYNFQGEVENIKFQCNRKLGKIDKELSLWMNDSITKFENLQIKLDNVHDNISKSMGSFFNAEISYKKLIEGIAYIDAIVQMYVKVVPKMMSGMRNLCLDS